MTNIKAKDELKNLNIIPLKLAPPCRLVCPLPPRPRHPRLIELGHGGQVLVLVQHQAQQLGLGRPHHLLVRALLGGKVPEVLVTLAAGVTRGGAGAVHLPVLALDLKQITAPKHGARLRAEMEVARKHVVRPPSGANQVRQLYHNNTPA